MDPKFVPPKSASEFKRRADPITVPAAKSILHGLRVRREKAVAPIDEEIKFYKRVIDYKETGNPQYEGDKGTTA